MQAYTVPLALLCAAIGLDAAAAEVWLQVDASRGGERLQVEVPYAWVEEGVITEALRDELDAVAADLPARAAHADALAPGARVAVATTPGPGERVAVSLVVKESRRDRARRVRVESWQGGAPETVELSIFAASAALPFLEEIYVDGEPLLGAAEEMLELDRALDAARDYPPTVLLDTSEGGHRLRVSTW